MYYNRDLWKELLGDRPPPTSFEEFLQVCEDVRERSKVLGKSISPMAGSRFTANVLMLPLFRSQTQRLWQDLNPMKDLAPPPPNFLNFLPGLATLDDPEIRNGLSMMRDIGKYLQEGFLQLDRDDAILMFGQGRALMLPTGVWDYGSVIEQSRFPIGFFQLPLPTPGSPVYGKSVLGPISEGVGTQGAGFHLSAKSKHPEVAVDFLRYLTSVKGNGLFSSISKWPPSVLGVEMQEDVRAFEPIKEGFPTGFDLSPLMYGSGSLYRLQEQALYTLFDQDGSADQFLTAVRPKFQEAIRDDVNRDIWNRERGVQRGDLVHAAEMMMEPSGGLEKSESGVSRRSRLEQSQNFQEVTAYRMKAQMENRLFPTRRSEASEKKEAE
jgi:ABC-type glycerol-3-phosphate transport system substrate-binding protein